MNAPDFPKILTEIWPSVVGGLIGGFFGHIMVGVPSEASRIRRQLGHALERFADVQATRLDAALLLVTSEFHKGWRAALSICGNAFCLSATIFCGAFSHLFFPQQPYWIQTTVAALAAGMTGALLFWSLEVFKRDAIIRRLESLLHGA